MNILYLNNSVHLGGDTRCILKLCKELKNKYNISMCSADGILVDEFKQLGINHFEINDVEDKSLKNIINIIISLRKIIKNNSIDIIHSHHRMTTLLAKIASKFTHVKVIHTQHLCIEDKFKLTRLALKNIDIITVSNSAKRILEEKCKLDGSRIITIYNSVETENENKTIDEKLIDLKEEGYFIVAQISRIIGYKGIYDFVDIAKEVIKDNTNIRFIFIGDGPEYNAMEKYIEEKKMKDYIFMLGSKDNVIEHLKYIDLVLLCSYIEGLPLVPIEAFSQNIPVIATNIDGTNEEIEDGYNGYLINNNDINKFKSKIINLYEDKELYKNLSDNSYEIFNKKFNQKLYVNSHIDIYRKG